MRLKREVDIWLGYQILCFLLRRAIRKKNETPFERAPRETPKSGVFLVHRRRRKIFLATQELESGQFGLRMAKTVHTKPTLCVFNRLCRCSGNTAPALHHQQASASKQHLLALGLCG